MLEDEKANILTVWHNDEVLVVLAAYSALMDQHETASQPA